MKRIHAPDKTLTKMKHKKTNQQKMMNLVDDHTIEQYTVILNKPFLGYQTM